MTKLVQGLFPCAVILALGCGRPPSSGRNPTPPQGSDGGTPTAVTPTGAGLASMPVISRNVPVFSSGDADPATVAAFANDADYSTQWVSSGIPSISAPLWIAYDLSSVPVQQRGRVLVVAHLGLNDDNQWAQAALRTIYAP